MLRGKDCARWDGDGLWCVLHSAWRLRPWKSVVLCGSPDFFDAITIIYGCTRWQVYQWAQVRGHQVQHPYLVRPLPPPASGQVLVWACGVPPESCFGQPWCAWVGQTSWEVADVHMCWKHLPYRNPVTLLDLLTVVRGSRERQSCGFGQGLLTSGEVTCEGVVCVSSYGFGRANKGEWLWYDS